MSDIDTTKSSSSTTKKWNEREIKKRTTKKLVFSSTMDHISRPLSTYWDASSENVCHHDKIRESEFGCQLISLSDLICIREHLSNLKTVSKYRESYKHIWEKDVFNFNQKNKVGRNEKVYFMLCQFEHQFAHFVYCFTWPYKLNANTTFVKNCDPWK